MKSFEYTIKDPMGVHARPAGILVKEAKTYKSKITISFNGKKEEATKLMKIMGMGIKTGNTITVEVEGEDEDAACEGMKKFLEGNL